MQSNLTVHRWRRILFLIGRDKPPTNSKEK
nr:MAG TPA: hypothetical protein [Caudoviricetes sp.]